MEIAVHNGITRSYSVFYLQFLDSRFVGIINILLDTLYACFHFITPSAASSVEDRSASREKIYIKIEKYI